MTRNQKELFKSILLEQPAGKNTKRRQLDALLDDMSNTGIRIATATAREIAAQGRDFDFAVPYG